MSVDDFFRGEADRALAARFCRFLLLCPLVTVPPTVAVGVSWFDDVVPLEHRAVGDAVLLHLPGLLYVYPAFALARRGRAGRLSGAVAAVGLIAYALPTVLWALVITSWRAAPPLVSDHVSLLMNSAHSAWYSFVLWMLILTLYRHARGDAARWRDHPS